MPDRYRAKLVNSLSGFKSANLVGTADRHGQTNLAIFSSVIHLGSSPALIGLISRPDSVERHTLRNILDTGQYTINQIHSGIYLDAHQTSARYEKSASEFTQTSLTPDFMPDCTAPFVKESKVKYGLKLKEVIDITSNNTQFVIGEITQIICDNSAITTDGYLDIEALNTITVSGLDSYHTTNRLSRLQYAKPNQKPSVININGEPIENDFL
ncbi:flavin reductase [Paraglaciecola aquimarina]|uniref:Flavin reductase n=1 Tax=Paraglaciecola algarum TaxID=3050085 RepID=A0ABS9D5R8_9ALTE|nr:flavin reductase [Paraglaciecola sp. G1-23]MCF2948216.1 flavin reductase [Paraglaciecola sp. G1-23]